MNETFQRYLSQRYPGLLAPAGEVTPYPDYPECSIECGDGWVHILDRAFRDLQERNLRIVQCKQKFGQLCLYVTGQLGSTASGDGVTEIDSLLQPYVDESTHTCEFCGDPGQILTVRSYMVVLCPHHAHLAVERKVNWSDLVRPHVWAGDTCRRCGCHGGMLVDQGIWIPQRNGHPVSLDCDIVKNNPW